MKKDITRREFLKRVGVASALVGTTAVLTNCAGGVGTDKVQETLTGRKPSGEKSYGDMEYRTNRRGDDKVSLLGYGMMRLPTVPKGEEKSDGNDLDQEMINRLVKTALEHGVNYFDTSPVYCKGFSEDATGIALQASGRPRNSYYIATKLSNFNPDSQSLAKSQEMFENSLKFLRTDYIDYLLLHAIGGNMGDINRRFIDNGLLDWLFEQKEKGRIRNLGFSFHGVQPVFDQLMAWDDEGKYKWDFVQIQMNYVDWKYAKPTAEYLYTELEKRGIPAVIMEPLLGGRLVKLPNPIVRHLQARRPEDSAASWAFRFLGTFPGVMTSLSGMTYMEHLEDNLHTHAPFEPLSDEEKAFILETADLIQNYPTIPCTGCQYCMPCPYGLDIPGIFKHYNKMVNEDSVPTYKEDANYRELRRKYLVSYDRSVEKLRQADHCVKCGICRPHCPQHINIPKELETLGRKVEVLKQTL